MNGPNHVASRALERSGVEAAGLVVAIDASRNRSGGAIAHLVGLLRAAKPTDQGIAAVHVWSYPALLAALPDEPWLVKHAPAALDRSIAHQLWWQYRVLPRELAACGCDVLLSTDAGTVCRFSPSVVMSRDMLSFEPGEMSRFRFSLAWLRLLALRFVQVASLRRATGALFLTEYASRVIRRYTGPLRQVRVIPHGLADRFRRPSRETAFRGEGTDIRCLYVSNVDLYKHQWSVVEAVAALRRQGHGVRLTLVGGGTGPARRKLDLTIAREDPRMEFVQVFEAVPHDEIAGHLDNADVFVFASSCENMPNTLIEAMASGLPIASSDRGPMPEILKDGGVYFDPERPESIAQALASLLDDGPLRDRLAARSKWLSDQYSWSRCARETWRFLLDVSAGQSMNPIDAIQTHRP